MPLPPGLRALDADLPACPRALVDLLALQRDDEATTDQMARVIESDMGLAAAVVRTVNSAMFGLLRRVQTVGEAVRYLGTREVTAITVESALRSSFAPTPAIEAVWAHASRASLLMGRSAPALGLDPMQAHSAGLFARSGQAVLLSRAAEPYGQLLARVGRDRRALKQAELDAFGISHAGLGSALCAAWGFAPEVVKYVREQLRAPADWALQDRALRRLLGLGAVVDAAIDAAADAAIHATGASGGNAETSSLSSSDSPRWPAQASARAAELAPFCACTADELTDAVRPPWQQLQRA
ncbi:MAG: HDOD domain-containing protein [Leptothrix sp. (in: b-proteobacteria)]